MGIKTVAVYSDADRDAVHVAMADEAVHIGPASAAAVLSGDREDRRGLQAPPARRPCTRATASSPSARRSPKALAAAGIVFIGPNLRRHRRDGRQDRIEEGRRRRRRLHRAGLPRGDREPGARRRDRRRHRLPGHDQGVRRRRRQGHAHRPFASGEVAEGFARAKSEAASSFGDDRVFIEKFITDPRHIEIQVIGDKHGNVDLPRRARVLDPAP